jgi:phage tail sheath protein FI
MPSFVAPGVYLVERDFSDFLAPISSTSLGLVITAKRGPLNERTLITSQDQFIETFGEPMDDSFGAHAALNYLRVGNELWVVRVARGFEEDVTIFDTPGTADVEGNIFEFDVETGHGITDTPDTYLRIREAGRASTVLAKVSNVATDTITTEIPLNDHYTDAASVDVVVSDLAASPAEIFAYGRRGTVPYRLVKFTAKNPGSWANYGSRRGLEVIIEDGGQFQNVDPVTGDPITSDGIALQGVIPSAASVDSFAELLAIASPVSGETRGVNRDSIATALTAVTTALVAASGVFTATGVFIDTQTTTIAARVYTFVTTLSGAADEVLIGVSLAASLTNWASAVNGSAGAGTTYGIGTVAHANGTAVAGATTLTFTHNTPGSGGNSVATTDTAANGGWGAATLAGGGNFTTFTVTSSTGLVAGDEFHIVGTAAWDTPIDTPYEILSVPNATSIRITAPGSPAANESSLTEASIEKVGGHHFGTVYRYNGSAWVAVGVLTKRVKVLYNGRQVEVFDNLIGYDATSPNFWDTVINASSQFITAEYLGSAVAPSSVNAPGPTPIVFNTGGEQPINTLQTVRHPYNPRLVFGLDAQVRNVAAASGYTTYTFRNPPGYDGSSPEAADYIGTISEDQVRTGLQLLRSTDLVDIALLAVPGVTTASVVQEILSICEDRHDCLGIIDPPMALTPRGVVDWHNGTGVYSGAHSPFVSNCAALYYSWIKQYDPYTRRDIYVPPSCVVPAVFAYSDSVGEPWFAAAGSQRGSINGAIGVETVITQGDMEFFYGPGNGNAVNPILSFKRDGIVVYGNRTLQRYATKLASINVRRGLFYFEKRVIQQLHRLNFEQNDAILWQQVRNVVKPEIRDMIGRRGLESGEVKCDADTNPPASRDAGECRVKIYLTPIGAAEKIIVEVTVLGSSVTIQESTAPLSQI